MLAIVLANAVLGIGLSFIPYVNVYAHLGGAAGGVLCGFATISKCDLCQKRPQKRSQSSARRASVETNCVAPPSVPTSQATSCGQTNPLQRNSIEWECGYNPGSGATAVESSRRWSVAEENGENSAIRTEATAKRVQRSNSVPDGQQSSVRRDSVKSQRKGSLVRQMTKDFQQRKADQKRLGIRRASMRMTPDEVDDSYQWGIGVCAVRLTAFAILLAFWIPLICLLFFNPDWKPPGQILG